MAGDRKSVISTERSQRNSLFMIGVGYRTVAVRGGHIPRIRHGSYAAICGLRSSVDFLCASEALMGSAPFRWHANANAPVNALTGHVEFRKGTSVKCKLRKIPIRRRRANRPKLRRRPSELNTHCG